MDRTNEPHDPPVATAAAAAAVAAELKQTSTIDYKLQMEIEFN